MLALRAVNKRYGDQTVLDGFDLQIETGETVVLLGRSGCGKSTVLRLLLGLETPDTGTVEFDGAPLDAPERRAARHRTGYVIQDGGLFPHLTARGNVILMANELGWSQARTAARVEALADLTHFPADALDRFPGTLSGGQRQRVALMRALMLEPDVLLLDEPLGALDPMIRFDLQRDLGSIIQRLSKTAVLVTHDLAEAGFFADRIVLMRAGRIEQQGSLASLVERPASPFVERFVNAQRGLPSAMDEL